MTNAQDTTPARAEAQDEGAAGEKNLGWFAGFARKHGHHAQADWLDQYARAYPSQPPAADEDRVRSALTDLVSWFDKPVQGERGMVWVIRAGDQGADEAVAEARSASKSEGRS